MKVGRKPIPVDYHDITYNSKDYIVGIIHSKLGTFKFVIDKEDFEKIKIKSWHITSTGYVSTYHVIDGVQKQILIHNLVMNRMVFPGKGATQTVDHINRNPLDNRKENLRIVSQTEQNINQKKKPRNIVKLPDTCGINPDEIPRHIWYIKPNGGHGDRFAIEFKTENIVWKSTSSKKHTLLEKLNQAKEKLQEFYTQFPYLNPETNDTIQQSEHLHKSYQEIVSLI